MNLILQWIDVLWLPIGWLATHKGQRLWMLGCILCGMVMMRMLTELMETIGYPHGMIGVLSAPVALRGLIVYSFFYAIYLLLAYISPRTKGAIFIAASITIFFAAMFTFAVVMVL